MCCIELMLSAIFAGNLFPFWCVVISWASICIDSGRSIVQCVYGTIVFQAIEREKYYHMQNASEKIRSQMLQHHVTRKSCASLCVCVSVSGCVPSTLKLWLIHRSKVATTNAYRILSTSASHTHKRIRICALHTLVQYTHDLPKSNRCERK